MLQQVINDLLFGLLAQSSDVEGDEFKLIQLSSHFSENSVDLFSGFNGQCTLSVFSVSGLVNIVVFVFLR